MKGKIERLTKDYSESQKNKDGKMENPKKKKKRLRPMNPKETLPSPVSHPPYPITFDAQPLPEFPPLTLASTYKNTIITSAT